MPQAHISIYDLYDITKEARRRLNVSFGTLARTLLRLWYAGEIHVSISDIDRVQGRRANPDQDED